MHAGQGRVAGIRRIRAARPLPHTPAAGQAAQPGRMFPFHLGWQPGTRPACICVSLVVAQVAHGLPRIQVAQAVKAKYLPALMVRAAFADGARRLRGRTPVEGLLPGLLLAKVPAFREPELRTAVAAIGQEPGKFFLVDRAAG